MLILRNIKRVKKLEQLFFLNYINVRFQSRERAVSKNDVEAFTRRYSKPLPTTERKCLSDDFVHNLYGGVVNKSIFVYPTVLQAAETDIVINHSAEVEHFLQDTPKDQLSEDTLSQMRKLELFGLSIPQKYGGAGYNETECKFLQECTGINSTIGRFLGYNENFGCKILNLYGTEEQKEKYLPRLAQGKSLISLAYLEDGPLIDLSKFEGFAINDEPNKTYILSAKKKWVHNADKADLFLVVVKLSELLDSELMVQVKLNFFIVERNNPGLIVHKLKSPYAQENNLFDVSFNDVVVQHENLLGNINTDGLTILRTALSHNNVTDAALCCHAVKHILYDATHFIQERKLENSSMQRCSFTHENLASLAMYLYALESTIYLVTGRFDTYDNPDLFNESILTKTLAIDILRVAIKKYIQIFGRESFKSSGFLNEAINMVQYYSVFDENIENFKLMISSNGIVHAGRKLSEEIKMLRNPFDNNFTAFKKLFLPPRMHKPKKNFKLELNGSLSVAAEVLEDSFLEFERAVDKFLLEYGKRALNSEHGIIKFGDMATYIYAGIASLSRASSSLCYDFSGCKEELSLASAFVNIAHAKIKELGALELRHTKLTPLYLEIGKETLNRKGYPVEHPLSRTY